MAAPIFCGFAAIRLARRSRIFGTPAGESAFSGPVSLRRFFFFLLAVVAVAGLTWGAALKPGRRRGRPRPRDSTGGGGSEALPPSASLCPARPAPAAMDATVDGRLAVAVVGRRDPARRGYGIHRRHRDPVTTETVFRWASLSRAPPQTWWSARRPAQLSLFAPVSRYSASLKLLTVTRTGRRSQTCSPARLFAPADPRLGKAGTPLSARFARLAAQYLPARKLPRLSERRL